MWEPPGRASLRDPRGTAQCVHFYTSDRVLTAGADPAEMARQRGTHTMSISRKNFLRGSALAAGALVLSKKSVAEETKAATAAAKPPPGPPPPNAVHFPVLKPSEFDGKRMMATFQQKKPHKFVIQSVAPHLIVPGL